MTTPLIQPLSQYLNQVVMGQEHVINSLLVALLANGHVLLEGLPGTAKTRSVKTLAKALQLTMGRVQFTPDLLPSDVTGYESLGTDGQLQFNRGPVFNEILLADEINRAPPKVQSALLEAMEERQITTGNHSHKLTDIFMVLATQNPIEQEGTYPLPEAQMDRFLLKVDIDYPNAEAELDILRLVHGEEQQAVDIPNIDGTKLITELREKVGAMGIAETLEKYIVALIMASREPAAFKDSPLQHWLALGASPRASIGLHKAARAQAVINDHEYVTPDDIRQVLPLVLGHRLKLSYQALAENISPSQVVAEIIQCVALPQ